MEKKSKHNKHSSSASNHEPTDFQNQISKMSASEFEARTNIRQIVIDEYKRYRNADKPMDPPENKIQEFITHYYEKNVPLTHKWRKCGLKHLKIITEDTDENGNQSGTLSVLKRKSTSPIGNHSAKKENKDQTPSKFQLEIIALDFDKFVSETNIEELISEGYQERHDNAQIPEIKMKRYLEFFYKRRLITCEWGRHCLRDLKFKLCECKRNKVFQSVQVQCEIVKTVECGVQTKLEPETNTESVNKFTEKSTSSMLVKKHRIEATQIEEIRMSQMESQFNASISGQDPLNSERVSTNKSLRENILAMPHISTECTPIEYLNADGKSEDFVVLLTTITCPETHNSAASSNHSSQNVIDETIFDCIAEIPLNDQVVECEDITMVPKEKPSLIKVSMSQFNDDDVIDSAASSNNSSQNVIDETIFDCIAEIPLNDQVVECEDITMVPKEKPSLVKVSTSQINDDDDQNSAASSNNSSQNVIDGTNEVIFDCLAEVPQIDQMSVENEVIGIVPKIEPTPNILSTSQINERYGSEVVIIEVKNEIELIEISDTVETEGLFDEVFTDNGNAKTQISNEQFKEVEQNLEIMFGDLSLPPASDSNLQLPNSGERPYNFYAEDTRPFSPENKSSSSLDKVSKDSIVVMAEAELEPQHYDNNVLQPKNIINNNLQINAKLPKENFKIKAHAKKTKQQKTKKGDDTLSTIQVPKYSYNALQIVSNKKSDEQTTSGNEALQLESCDIETHIQETPPINRTNPNEYQIDENSSTDDSQVTPNKNPSTSVSRLLNSQISVFLSSQLNICGSQCSDAQTGNSLTPADSEASSTPSDLVCSPITSQMMNAILKPELSAVQKVTSAKQNTDNLFNINEDVNECEPLPKKPKLSTDNVQVAKEIVTSENLFRKAIELNHTKSLALNQPKRLAIAPNSPAFIVPMEQIMKTPNSISNNAFHTFLHYIDIENVSYRFKMFANAYQNRQANNYNELNDIKTILNYQCNGVNKITINGESTRKLLKLSYKEWSAVQDLLKMIGEFSYNSKATEPPNATILHRVLYYLFKTASKFSNVLIEYREEDMESVRVINASYAINPLKRNRDLSKVIDPLVLMHIKHKREHLKTK